jgi:hypothetical protein
MLHSSTVNAAVHQVQGGQAGAGLGSKLAEKRTIAQLCPDEFESVKGGEGVRDEVGAT